MQCAVNAMNVDGGNGRGRLPEQTGQGGMNIVMNRLDGEKDIAD